MFNYDTVHKKLAFHFLFNIVGIPPKNHEYKVVEK